MSENILFGNYKAPTIGPVKVIQKIERGLFFDGTGNNKDNVLARLNNTETYQKYKDSNSYKGDWSNVARIWSCSEADYAIYIDGTGTKANEDDDVAEGQGLGTGKWGVPARVTEGCRKLVDSLPKGVKKINTLIVDAYGFSRGAATARSFVANISSVENKNFFKNPFQQEWNHYRGALGIFLKEQGIEVSYLKIRFLCIFDTVSSYNWGVTVTPNFMDDIGELRLNDLHRVEYIMHFTAENEHREFFALTRVPKHLNVEEINLPGIHGDVGGGINSGLEIVKKIKESSSRKPLEDLKKELIDEYWYTEDQLEILPSTKFEINKFGITVGIPGYWRLQGTRMLDNKLSFVPLHLIMRRIRDRNLQIEAGLEKGKSISYPKFNEKQLRAKYPITDIGNEKLLNDLKRLIFLRAAALGIFDCPVSLRKEDGSYTPIKQALKEMDEGVRSGYIRYLPAIRNKYVHWSARFEDFGMHPAKDRKRIELKP